MKPVIQLYVAAIGFLLVLVASLEVIARHQAALTWLVVLGGLVIVGRMLWRRSDL